MSAASPSPRAVGHGLSDWLAGPSDDALYTSGESLHQDDMIGVNSWSLDGFGDEAAFLDDGPVDERQAIYEEMQAVGLNRPGGFMRQAFSLGDLTLLQPPNEMHGAMANTWSSSSSEAQVTLCRQSELPELCSFPANSPQHPYFATELLRHSPDVRLLSSQSSTPDRLGFGSTTPVIHMAAGHDAGLGCIPEHEMLQSIAPAPSGHGPHQAGYPHLVNTASFHQADMGSQAAKHVRPSSMRRSQSALELSSIAAPGVNSASHQHGSAPKQVGVELTTPEGHTYRAGRLAPAERLQKILKYRQKRHERNFTKRIKYQCRKTLADSRPRVRGRFARNDDLSAVMPSDVRKRAA